MKMDDCGAMTAGNTIYCSYHFWQPGNNFYFCLDSGMNVPFVVCIGIARQNVIVVPGYYYASHSLGRGPVIPVISFLHLHNHDLTQTLSHRLVFIPLLA